MEIFFSSFKPLEWEPCPSCRCRSRCSRSTPSKACTRPPTAACQLIWQQRHEQISFHLLIWRQKKMKKVIVHLRPQKMRCLQKMVLAFSPARNTVICPFRRASKPPVTEKSQLKYEPRGNLFIKHPKGCWKPLCGWVGNFFKNLSRVSIQFWKIAYFLSFSSRFTL